MKNRYYKIFIMLVAIAISSCNKMLDIKPVNSMIPVSVEDYESILVGGYPRVDYFMKTELMTDNVYANLSSTRNPDKPNEPWFVWSSNHLQDGIQIDPYWGQLYKSIYYANTVLDEFSNRTPLSEEKDLFETVKGEAYALRAYSYFYLVNLYADVYSANTLNAPGVPMPLSANNVHENTQNNTRETIGNVWKQILTDINSAELLLTGKIGKSKFRFDAVSLQAFKSRVLLFMGNYKDAITAASNVIAARPLSNLNTMQARIDDKGNEYAYSGTFGFIDGDYKNEVLFFTGGEANRNIFYYASYMLKPSHELFALTERSAALDYRKYIFASFKDPNSVDGVEIGTTMYNMFAKQENPSYYIGLKISEAYVTRAEAYARLEQKDKAIADLNKLLVTRIKKEDFQALNDADFNNASALERVLEERRLELAFDGGLRWFDLRRNGKPALSHIYLKGVEYKLQQNDPRYILQIPLSEQENSPQMPINPR